jgi:hypothetical protein
MWTQRGQGIVMRKTTSSPIASVLPAHESSMNGFPCERMTMLGRIEDRFFLVASLRFAKKLYFPLARSLRSRRNDRSRKLTDTP